MGRSFEEEEFPARAGVARLTSAGADFPQRKIELVRSIFRLSSRRIVEGRIAALIHHVRQLVIQVERVDWRDEALAPGAGDGNGLFPNASGQVLRQWVGQEPPDLRCVSRQQCSAEAVKVCEHWSP